MATMVVSRLLGYKTIASCLSVRNEVVFYTHYFIYISFAFACSCLSLFIYRFKVLSFFSFVGYNLVFLDRKIDVWQVTIYTLHPPFYYKVTTNFSYSYSSFFYFWVTSNFLLFYGCRLGACYIVSWWWLMTFLLLELSIKLFNLLLNISDNDITSS